MARRASSSPPAVRVLLPLAVLLVLGGGGFFLYHQASDPFRTIAVLPVQEYLENANGLRGNTYRWEGTVARTIDWSEHGGRLFSVENSAGEVVPLLVPPELNGVNIERGQKFRFKVEVGQQGILRVKEAQKV